MTPPTLESVLQGGVSVVARAAVIDRHCRLAALSASVAFAIAWTLLLGKAFHWDAINYHLYLGFAALNDRFSLDFFAAGTPSYINPYAYIPLHLLIDSGASALLVASALAAAHGLIFWLTYEFALALGPKDRGRERYAFAVLAMVLAALNPVLLQGIGMTLIDIPLGVLVLAAWLALALALRDGNLLLVVLGAALGGLAAGLKLSNALYAAAAMSTMAFLPGGWQRKSLAAVVYGLACGCAFLAVSAPWSWKLWESFGNPLFPFMNDLFKSPDFTSAPIHYERFRPSTFVEFLARPFDMLSSLSRQHTESRAPDLRYAALFLAMAALAIAFLLNSHRVRGLNADVLSSARRNSRQTDAATRILVAFCVAFVIAWCIWLKFSGNSRYFIPMGCVASGLLAEILRRSYHRWKDATSVAVGLVVLAQVVQLGVAADLDRDGIAWDGPFLKAEYPSRYRDEPYLFLSSSFLSGSAFLPKWHPQSGMMSISGFYAIGPGRPGWERAQKLIARNGGRLRILQHLPPGFGAGRGLPGPIADLDPFVQRFGLEVDASDCDYIRLQSNLQDAARTDPASRWTNWVTCRLRPAPEAAERYEREVREVDPIFDRIEDVCPNLFHPPRPLTERYPNWTRLYNLGSEIQLWMNGGRIFYRAPLLGGDPVDIGSVEAWSIGPQPIDCQKKFNPAFGGLLK